MAGGTGGAVAGGSGLLSHAIANAAVPHPAAGGGPIMSGAAFPIDLF